jgi:thiol-disulfide isomerase/thioredoxin
LAPRAVAGVVARAVAASALALVAVTGCSQTMGGAEGFVSGSGTVTVLGGSERMPAPPLSGPSLYGRSIALDDFSGSTVVMNVWGSWCAPCRAEAHELVRAAHRLRDDHVQFLGVDVRESGMASGRAFVRNYDVPYPSVYDEDGSTLLGFRNAMPPSAIPSTLVIDAQGRVAARVLGPVDTGTLVDLVHEVQGRAQTQAQAQAGDRAKRGSDG